MFRKSAFFAGFIGSIQCLSRLSARLFRFCLIGTFIATVITSKVHLLLCERFSASFTDFFYHNIPLYLVFRIFEQVRVPPIFTRACHTSSSTDTISVLCFCAEVRKLFLAPCSPANKRPSDCVCTYRTCSFYPQQTVFFVLQNFLGFFVSVVKCHVIRWIVIRLCFEKVETVKVNALTVRR